MNLNNSVLIIDDDAITVFGIKKLLDSAIKCTNVQNFPNGKLALDYLINLINSNKNLPDFIFLDLNMPIMDGWEFMEEFIKLPILEKITVNIVTSSINIEDRVKSETYKYRTHHHITYNTKPLNVKEILKITILAEHRL